MKVNNLLAFVVLGHPRRRTSDKIYRFSGLIREAAFRDFPQLDAGPRRGQIRGLGVFRQPDSVELMRGAR